MNTVGEEVGVQRRLRVAGLTLGVGLAGFFDGIVLHQILQWHHFVSNIYPSDTVAGLEMNTLWDGLFHGASYIVTIIGLVLLWRALMRTHARYTLPLLSGAVLMGAGGFNLLENIVNHWILRIHHVRSGPNEVAYDLAFLVIALMLIALGAFIYRQALRSA